MTTRPARTARLASTVLVCAVLLSACGGKGEDPTAAAPGATASTDTTLELTVPAAPSGRCMMPSVENLQAQDTAFEGVVTALAVGTATLDVTKSLKGGPVDLVTVLAPSQDLQDLVLAVDFERGQTYLVSSLDGQVSVCGLSGPKDDRLTGLYEQAYAG